MSMIPRNDQKVVASKWPEPVRVQRKRTKGWRMPPNTVYVGRPSKWGNPFPIEEYGPRLAVFNFWQRMRNLALINPGAFDELRGKNLACWCAPDQPCHANALLEIANPGLLVEGLLGGKQ